MSDCDAVALIHDFINYAPTPEDSVADVLLAGKIIHSSLILKEIVVK